MRRLIKSAIKLQNYSTSRASSNTVGFIGLGNMGAPMAINLKNKGGFDVVAYDISDARFAEL